MKNVEDIYPLSPMQQGILFQALKIPGDYFEQLTFTLEGPVDPTALEHAWSRVLSRHPILRTGFLWEGLDEPLQVVRQRVDLPWRLEDWSGVDETEYRQRLETLWAEDRRRGFELGRAPLLRLTLIRREEERWLLVWNHHHLILDGWSAASVFDEVSKLYEGRRRGVRLELPHPRPFSAFIAWLREHDQEADRLFWHGELAGVRGPTRLAVGGHGSSGGRGEGEGPGLHRRRLSSARTAALRAFARRSRVTLNTLVQGAWAILLSRYSGSEDVIFGTTLSGRPADLAGVEEMVGLFINTLPLRLVVPPRAECARWLVEVQKHHGAVHQHEHASLPQIQQWSGAAPGQPLFESILVFENYPLEMELQRWGGDLEIRLHQPFVGTNFPLTLGVLPEEELEIWGLFDRERFSEALISRLLRHLETLLHGMTVRPEGRLEDLPLLDEAEDRKLLSIGTPEPVGEVAPVPVLVSEQEELRAEAAALVGDTGEVTYGELGRRARSLAQRLRVKGLETGEVVGIDLDEPVERAVAMLGVLTAGGACLAFAPTDPWPWKIWQLQDSRASWLLARDQPTEVAELPPRVRWLDPRLANGNSDAEGAAGPTMHPQPEDLAWVAYPTWRGVEVDHRALAVRIHQLAEEVRLGPEDGVLHWPGGTDLAWDLWLPLIHGARAVVSEASRSAPWKAPEWLSGRGVTVAQLTTEELTFLLRAAVAGTQLSLREVICGGEVPQALVDRLAVHGGILHRLYGATEVGEGFLRRRGRPGEAQPLVPAGRPAPGAAALLLDHRRRPVPPGVIGELHAAGVTLARRFTDPEESSHRVWNDPAGGGRRITTGDLAWMLEDGDLALVASRAGGCWIGGRRVDPAEGEAVLGAHPAVVQCAVVPRRTAAGDEELVAYYVASTAVSEARLFEHLRSRLPSGRLPRCLVPVSNLPYTASGHLDIPALERLPVADEDALESWRGLAAGSPGVTEAVAVLAAVAPVERRWHLQQLVGEARRSGGTFPGAGARGPEPPAAGFGPSGVGNERTPSEISGAIWRRPTDAPTNLPEALEAAARRQPERGIHYPSRSGGEEVQTYSELLAESRLVLSGLRRRGLKAGDRVLFQLEQPREFLPAFWGAVLGGMVPVPVTVPPAHRSDKGVTDRLVNVWKLLDRPLILAGASQAEVVRHTGSERGLGGWCSVELEEVLAEGRQAGDGVGEIHRGDPDATALLLLTSGSTGTPKAVRQTQRTLLDRSLAVATHNGFDSWEVSLNWFPLDHVGGLVMFHLRDVVVGCRQIQARTADVLEDPLRWLDWLEHYRATITWAPNFAFGLINDRSDELSRRRWDLSSLRFILNGGEAIVARTARRFLTLLAPHGLPPTAMHPAWGMSETCSGVVYSHLFRLDTTRDDDPFVEVGSPIPGISLRIADGEDRPVAQGQPGHLQIRGISVTPGYWGDQDLDQDAFTADGWFDTGDLGVLREGRLTITGRAKDVIIVNGVNYYSHELEAAVEEVPGLEVSFTAACAVREEGADTDGLAVFLCPAEDVGDDELGPLLQRVRDRLASGCGVAPRYLVPVTRDQIPKTTIGKIQRSRLRQAFEAGELDAELCCGDLALGDERTLPAWFFRLGWQPRPSDGRLPLTRGGRALIFLDRHGLGERLQRRLQAADWSSVVVEAGSSSERLDASRLRLQPGDPESLCRLLREEVEDGPPFDWVVHLWGRGGPAGAPCEPAAGLEADEVGLLTLASALEEICNGRRPLRLQVVTGGALRVLPGEQPSPGRAAVASLVATLTQEMPWLDARHLDLPEQLGHGDLDRLLDEMLALDGERQVACRLPELQRVVPALIPVDLTAEPPGELPVAVGGTYVITGGLGGLGSVVARWLLAGFQGRLLLLGRTPEGVLGSEARRRLEELRELPGEVDYQAVDVTDGEALAAAVDTAEERWGQRLGGAFHLAGVLEERALREETAAGLARVRIAKVGGAVHLRRLLTRRPDAFLVAFSSANGLFGGAGVGAYAAANGALDEVLCDAGEEGAPPLWNLSWSLWSGVGMSRGVALTALSQSRGFHPLTPREGLISLEAVLRRRPGRWVVGLDATRPGVRRRTSLPAEVVHRVCVYLTVAKQGVVPPHPTTTVPDRFGRPVPAVWTRVEEIPRDPGGQPDFARLAGSVLAGSGAAHGAQMPRNETERQVAAIFRELLKLDRLGVEDSFFALGGHSLLATQLVNRLRTVLRRELPLERIFEEPTVAAIARLVEASEDGAGSGGIPRGEDENDAIRPLERGSGSLEGLLEELERGR